MCLRFFSATENARKVSENNFFFNFFFIKVSFDNETEYESTSASDSESVEQEEVVQTKGSSTSRLTRELSANGTFKNVLGHAEVQLLVCAFDLGELKSSLVTAAQHLKLATTRQCAGINPKIRAAYEQGRLSYALLLPNKLLLALNPERWSLITNTTYSRAYPLYGNKKMIERASDDPEVRKALFGSLSAWVTQERRETMLAAKIDAGHLTQRDLDTTFRALTQEEYKKKESAFEQNDDIPRVQRIGEVTGSLHACKIVPAASGSVDEPALYEFTGAGNKPKAEKPSAEKLKAAKPKVEKPKVVKTKAVKRRQPPVRIDELSEDEDAYQVDERPLPSAAAPATKQRRVLEPPVAAAAAEVEQIRQEQYASILTDIDKDVTKEQAEARPAALAGLQELVSHQEVLMAGVAPSFEVKFQPNFNLCSAATPQRPTFINIALSDEARAAISDGELFITLRMNQPNLIYNRLLRVDFDKIDSTIRHALCCNDSLSLAVFADDVKNTLEMAIGTDGQLNKLDATHIFTAQQIEACVYAYMQLGYSREMIKQQLRWRGVESCSIFGLEVPDNDMMEDMWRFLQSQPIDSVFDQELCNI